MNTSVRPASSTGVSPVPPIRPTDKPLAMHKARSTGVSPVPPVSHTDKPLAMRKASRPQTSTRSPYRGHGRDGLRATCAVTLVLIALALLAFITPAHAQEPTPADDPAIVLIPDEDWDVLLQRYPDGVVLDYARYREIRRLALDHGYNASDEPPPLPSIVKNVVYTGAPVVDENGALTHMDWTVTATIDVLATGSAHEALRGNDAAKTSWIEWTLRLHPFAVQSVTEIGPAGGDAQPVVCLVGNSGFLRLGLQGLGEHRVTITGHSRVDALDGGQRRISLATSNHPVATLAFTLPDNLAITHASVPLHETETGHATAFGGRTQIDVVVAPRTDEASDRDPIRIAHQRAHHMIGAGQLTSRFTLTVAAYQAAMSTLRVRLPDDVVLASIVSERLRDWRYPDLANDPRLIEISFATPVLDASVAVTLTLSRALDGAALSDALALPMLAIADDVHRIERLLSITVAPEYLAHVTPGAGQLETAIPDDVQAPPRSRSYAYRAWGELSPVTVRLRPTDTRIEATVRELWAIGDHLQELNAACEFAVTRGETYYVALSLPAGFELANVTSSFADGAYEWSQSAPAADGTTTLSIDLAQKLIAGESITVAVSMLRSVSTADLTQQNRMVNAPVVRPVGAGGSGAPDSTLDARLFVGIAAGRHVAISFEGSPARKFRSVDLDVLRALAIDHDDLALGLRADSADAIANIALSPRPARVRASVVVMAAIDNQLVTAARVQLDVQDAPIASVTLSVPETVESMSVLYTAPGPDGRPRLVDARDRLSGGAAADGVRRFTLSFEQRFLGRRALYVTIVQQGKTGSSVGVPWIGVPGSEFAAGVLAIEAAQGSELAVEQSRGLEAMDVIDFPVVFHPSVDDRHRFQHAFKTFEPTWNLVVKATAHAPVGVLPAVAEVQTVATILAATGEELVFVDYALTWSNVQGVLVDLPEGADLLAVLRRDTGVDPATGYTTDVWSGLQPQVQDGGLIVPLLARPGNDGVTRATIRLVYQRDTGEPLTATGSFTPDFPSLRVPDPERRVPVLHTSWTLYLPPGFEAVDSEGDMEVWVPGRDPNRPIGEGNFVLNILRSKFGDGGEPPANTVAQDGITTASSSTRKIRERSLGDNVGGDFIGDNSFLATMEGRPLPHDPIRLSSPFAPQAEKATAEYAHDDSGAAEGGESYDYGYASNSDAGSPPPETFGEPRHPENDELSRWSDSADRAEHPNEDPRFDRDSEDAMNEDQTDDPRSETLRPSHSNQAMGNNAGPGRRDMPADGESSGESPHPDSGFNSSVGLGGNVGGGGRNGDAGDDDSVGMDGRSLMPRIGGRATGSAGMTGPHAYLTMSLPELTEDIDLATLDEALRRKGLTSLRLAYDASDALGVHGNVYAGNGISATPVVKVTVRKQADRGVEMAIWLLIGLVLSLIAIVARKINTLLVLAVAFIIAIGGLELVGDSAILSTNSLLLGAMIAVGVTWIANALLFVRKKLALPMQPFATPVDPKRAAERAAQASASTAGASGAAATARALAPLVAIALTIALLLAGTHDDALAQSPRGDQGRGVTAETPEVPEAAELLTNGAATEVAFAPYDPKDPQTLEQINRVFVPYDRYVALYNAAFPDRPLAVTTPEERPADAVVYATEFNVRATLAPGAARPALTATARYRVEVFADGPQEVVLGLGGAAITRSLFIEDDENEGAPGDLRVVNGAYRLRVTGPTRGSLEVDVSLPAQETAVIGASNVTLATPNAPGNRLRVVAPDGYRPELIATAGGGVLARDEAAGTVTLDALLGANETVTISVAPESAGPSAQTRSFKVNAAHRHTVRPDRADVSATMTMTVDSGSVDVFTIDLPDGFTLRRVTGQQLRGWTLEDGGSALTINLHRATTTATTITIEGEVDAQAPRTPGVTMPGVVPRVIVRDAFYQHGTVELHADAGLTLAITDLVSINRAATGGAVRRYDYVVPTFTLGYETGLEEARLGVATHAMVSATDELRELGVVLDVNATGRPVFGFTIAIGDVPEGEGQWDLREVTGQHVKDYREETAAQPDGTEQRVVRVLLSQALSGSRRYHVRLEREKLATDNEATPFTLPTVSIVDGHRPTFDMGVATSVDLAVRVNGPRGLTETALQRFAFWYLRDASMRARTAFAYPGEMPAGIVIAPQRLYPKVALTTLSHTRIEDDWLTYAIFARFQIEEAPVGTFVLDVPRWLSNFATEDTPPTAIGRDLQVLGPNIESVTAQLVQDSDWLSLSIKLHAPVMGELELAVFPPLHRTRGEEVRVPAVRAYMRDVLGEGTLREEHAITVDNRTGREILGIEDRAEEKIEPERLSYVPDTLRARGPFKPTLCYRIRDLAEPTLICKTTVHATVALQGATARTLAVTSVLGPDGELRHQLDVYLTNRTLQFVVVQLPADAELWAVTVDGTPVKPVTDAADPTVAAQQGRVLVPVPKTRVGDLDLHVRLVYVTIADRLRDISELALTSPSLVNVDSVEETFWTLYLPPTLQGEIQWDRSTMSHSITLASDLELDRLSTLTIGLAEQEALVARVGGNLSDREAASIALQIDAFNKQVARCEEALLIDEYRVGSDADHKLVRERIDSNRATYDELASKGNAVLDRLQYDANHRLWMDMIAGAVDDPRSEQSRASLANAQNVLDFSRVIEGKNDYGVEQLQQELERQQEYRRFLDAQANAAPPVTEADRTATRSLEEAQAAQRAQAGANRNGAAQSTEEAELQEDLNRYRSGNYRQQQQAAADGRVNQAFSNELRAALRNEVVSQSWAAPEGAPTPFADQLISSGRALAPVKLGTVGETGAGQVSLVVDLVGGVPADYVPIRAYQEAGNGVELTLALSPAPTQSINGERIVVIVLALAIIVLAGIVAVRGRGRRIIGSITVGGLFAVLALVGGVVTIASGNGVTGAIILAVVILTGLAAFRYTRPAPAAALA